MCWWLGEGEERGKSVAGRRKEGSFAMGGGRVGRNALALVLVDFVVVVVVVAVVVAVGN